MATYYMNVREKFTIINALEDSNKSEARKYYF